jgi:hypothetical protein
MSELITLDLLCPHCGGESSAEFADWRNDADQIETVLACPFCSRTWRAAVPARLLWVVKRSENPRTQH